MENLDLLYGCFSQYTFSLAKENIDTLQYYYDTNADTSGSPLVANLVQAIKNYDLDALGLPLFKSILSRSGKTEAEANEILSKIIQYKQYSKEQMAPARKEIIDVVAKVLVHRASYLYQNDPSGYIKYLKNLDFKTSEVDYLNTTSFNQIDINTIVADGIEDVIPSKFDFINESYPSGGYEKGQLVIVCMPPGQGKSLFLMEEILNMALHGKKCFYYAAGDINYRDFLIRMGAQFTGWPFGEVKRHLVEVYKELSKALGDNLDICITPAGVVSARELVDFVKSSPKNYEVVGIDYDSNLKIDAGDNMYDAFGQCYMTFSELTTDTKYNKLVFVCAQPKVQVWGEPIINLQDVGESSRKQHSADMIITRGREINCPNHVAPMKIVKNRRGETDVIGYSIRLNNGRTKVVPKTVYLDLKQVSEKRDYGENEIDQMVNSFLQSRAHVSNNINTGNIAQVQTNRGPSPF